MLIYDFRNKYTVTVYKPTIYFTKKSCAIAKTTAQCALHMGALKIFGTP